MSIKERFEKQRKILEEHYKEDEPKEDFQSPLSSTEEIKEVTVTKPEVQEESKEIEKEVKKKIKERQKYMYFRR